MGIKNLRSATVWEGGCAPGSPPPGSASATPHHHIHTQSLLLDHDKMSLTSFNRQHAQTVTYTWTLFQNICLIYQYWGLYINVFLKKRLFAKFLKSKYKLKTALSQFLNKQIVGVRFRHVMFVFWLKWYIWSCESRVSLKETKLHECYQNSENNIKLDSDVNTYWTSGRQREQKQLNIIILRVKEKISSGKQSLHGYTYKRRQSFLHNTVKSMLFGIQSSSLIYLSFSSIQIVGLFKMWIVYSRFRIRIRVRKILTQTPNSTYQYFPYFPSLTLC